jgi:N-acetylmuramoyl-L-alanine amidase
MRHIRRIIIHCAATKNGRALGNPRANPPTTAAGIINTWHRARRFRRMEAARRDYNPGLCCVGYHWIIDVDGSVHSGRHPDEIGAHAAGHNTDSIGICMIGTDAFTIPQWLSLKKLVEQIRSDHPTAQCLGHRDTSPDLDRDGKVEKHEWIKTCPGFDVAEWEQYGRGPLHGHINPP